MSKFLALNIAISADGYMAGPNQSLENPLGENGKIVHEWVFPTKAFHEWIGAPEGSEGVDNDYVARGFTNMGATIMGRNMFGPVRGPWLNDDWKGWWGPNPGFKYPVFILTHNPRESIDMGNGTIFHFVTGGVEQACELALAAAKGKDIRVGGGANTLQQLLEASLLDELHTAQVAADLGSGEKLFTHPEIQLAGYRKLEPVLSSTVIHQTYVRK